MPVPPNLDPNIMAFSTICERLSRIEETSELLREHLRREEMCKVHGSLNSALLGFPSWLQIHLHAERSQPDSVAMRGPFLEGSIIRVECKGKCDANSFEDLYNPLYRRYFPEKAEAMIKFERENEEAASCSQFDIQGRKELLCSEVECRATRDALDLTNFSSFLDLDDDELSCGSLLITKEGERVDLSGHIRQALAIIFARGHRRECIEALEITPCSSYAKPYLQAVLDYKRKKPEDRDSFVRDHRLSFATGWPSYFRDHSVLKDYADDLKTMLQELRW